MRRSKQQAHETPEVYVTLYCRATSHVERWVIETFVPFHTYGPVVDYGGGDRMLWRSDSHQWLDGAFVRTTSRHSDVGLIEDEHGAVAEVINPRSRGGAIKIGPADRESRYRGLHKLRCHLCGDCVRRRGEELQRDLFLVAAQGWRDVPLDVFRQVGALR